MEFAICTVPVVGIFIAGASLFIYLFIYLFLNYYSTTNKIHLFLKLFILVKRSTCFGRSLRPSSGAQNCTYGNRHTEKRTRGMPCLKDGSNFDPQMRKLDQATSNTACQCDDNWLTEQLLQLNA